MMHPAVAVEAARVLLESGLIDFPGSSNLYYSARAIVSDAKVKQGLDRCLVRALALGVVLGLALDVAQFPTSVAHVGQSPCPSRTTSASTSSYLDRDPLVNELNTSNARNGGGIIGLFGLWQIERQDEPITVIE